LLPVFDLSITPRRSTDYCRLVWVVTLWAGIWVYYSSIPGWLGLLLDVCMAWSLWKVHNNPRPYPTLPTLMFQKEEWLIKERDLTSTYKKIRICADTGFFLLLHFSESTQAKPRWLVVFYDQLTEQERRALHIITTVYGSASKR
jgi:hypothetical protein